MNNLLFYTLKTTTQQEFSTHYPLYPSIFYKAVNFFSKAYLANRWIITDWTLFKKREEYLQRNKGDPAIYGTGLYALSQYSPICSSAIGLGLMVQCIDELFQAHLNVYQSYQELVSNFSSSYPVYKEPIFSKTRFNQPSILPFSWRYRINSKIMQYCQAALQIIKQIGHLLGAMWNAAAYERDIYLILTCQEEARLRACTQLIIRIFQNQDQLKINPNHLKEHIIRRQVVIDRILTQLGMKETSEYFITQLMIESAKQAAEHAPTVLRNFQTFVKPIWEPGKMTAWSLFPKIEQPFPKLTLPSPSSSHLVINKVQTFLNQSKEQIFNTLNQINQIKLN